MLCNRRVGRLLFGSPDGLREVGRVDDDTRGRHRQGGLSQPRYERSIDNEALAHVKHVAELVGRRFGRRALDGILLGGPEETRARLEDYLPNGLRGRVVGCVDVDVDTASPEDVRTAERARIDDVSRCRLRRNVRGPRKGHVYRDPACDVLQTKFA